VLKNTTFAIIRGYKKHISLKISNYTKVSELLKSGGNLLISTHKNPDGDTIGSALGLYHFLQTIGIKSQIIGVDPAPEFLSWMPGYVTIVNNTDSPNQVQQLIEEADVIVHVDYNAYHRVGNVVEKHFENANAKDLMIDHHPHPQEGFNAYISDVSACSTAQLVYNLIIHMSASSIVNKDSAICLYVGIMTDTGSFSYGMSDEQPYQIAAALVRSGIDDKWIHQQVYNSNTFDRMRLLGFALSEKLKVMENENWAYISLEKEELKRFNFQPGDNEGLVNYALSIKGIKAAVMLTEKDDLIRISFRSKDEYAINQIAREYFDGGGHKNAAGGNSYKSMPDTIKQLKQVMTEFSKQFEE